MDNKNDNKLLTIGEAAEILKCSHQTLYRMVEKNCPLPIVRVGKLIRFTNEGDLVRYFKRGRRVQNNKKRET